MSYQAESGWKAPSTKLTLAKPKGELGKFDKKPEHPNKTAGIFIGVALKNVFGGLSLDEVLTLATNEGKLNQVLKVVNKIVDYQVESAKAVEARL